MPIGQVAARVVLPLDPGIESSLPPRALTIGAAIRCQRDDRDCSAWTA